MKRDKIITLCWAGGLAFLLGLGSVASLATGLDLPVNIRALLLWCAALAVITALCASFDWGMVTGICLGAIVFLNPDFWTELKTLAAAVALRLELGYGIPIPALLQGELADSVLAALCMLAGVIMLLTARCVQKKKSCLPAVLASLIPLAGCITVNDTVPDTPWLFLWGLGLVMLLLTQGVRQRSHRKANRLCAWMLLPTLGALVLLFMLVPRDAPDKWGLPIPDLFAGASQGASAPTPEEKVDLTKLGPRTLTNTPVMEVTADFSGPLYLRVRDYDHYTGTGWHATQHRSEILYGFSPTWHLQTGRVEIETAGPQSYYVIPSYTQEVQSLTNGIVENPDRQTAYGFDHCILQPDWDQIWTDGAAPMVNPRYLNLPDSTARLAAEYMARGGWTYSSILERVEQIRQAVRSTAPYDLFTPNMPQGETDLAMWFLNQAETGYCVHYATAAAVLLRSSGIPARYVEGYLVPVEKGKTTTVRGLHAHAWVEYYVDGAGWVVLEATPSGGDAPEAIPTTAPTEATEDPTGETEPVTGDLPTTEPGETQPNRQDPAPKPQPAPWIGKALLWIAGLCLALALVFGQYFLRRQLFRRRIRQGSANRSGLAVYRQLVKLRRFLKQPVPQEMTQLAQKARFSSHSLTQQERNVLLRQLHKAEQEAKTTPWHRRLLAKWIFALY